jgi:hypothetical protein
VAALVLGPVVVLAVLRLALLAVAVVPLVLGLVVAVRLALGLGLVVAGNAQGGETHSVNPSCCSADVRFGVVRHVFRCASPFVSEFLRLHPGRAVDHSLGAVKNPERDHLSGRTGQDAGMWAVSTAGFIRSPPRCNATFLKY